MLKTIVNAYLLIDTKSKHKVDFRIRTMKYLANNKEDTDVDKGSAQDERQDCLC